jgi:rSAM/selenodomain-associated transferase 1
LATALGAERAAQLYDAFLVDLCSLARAVPNRVLAVTELHPRLQTLAREFGLRLELQEGVDLGERMKNAIERWLRKGPVCLIGSDSPTLREADLLAGFDKLAAKEFVLGPTADGGYWLIGARRRVPAVFSDIAWSTPTVFAETRRRLGSQVELLRAHYDVDDADDLARLGAELAELPETVASATRAVLR